eukprot:8280311-Alexandrium_andersonii.AAC.1
MHGRTYARMRRHTRKRARMAASAHACLRALTCAHACTIAWADTDVHAQWQAYAHACAPDRPTTSPPHLAPPALAP